jgi:hypothetical protein
MSFLKRLFGGGGREEADLQPAKELEHNGFVIRATPFKEEGQFQTCGVIAKQVGGSLKEHRFIRADRFSTLEDAADHALRKGRQIVDEQGDGVFG